MCCGGKGVSCGAAKLEGEMLTVHSLPVLHLLWLLLMPRTRRLPGGKGVSSEMWSNKIRPEKGPTFVEVWLLGVILLRD